MTNDKKVFRKVWLGLFFLLTIYSMTSCKKYLELKSDKSLVEPKTLEDAQALLDYYTFMNAAYPVLGVEADDDYYLLDADFNKMTAQIQQRYTWDKSATVNDYDWSNLYQNVLYANMALETTLQVPVSTDNEDEWKRLKGAALFFRAYNFYWIANYFTIPYDESAAKTSEGIPLRLTADVNEQLTRSTLEQTFIQMIGDLKESISLLPNVANPASRPSKAAAYGQLARVYMMMRKYDLAGLYADSCLQVKKDLVDYNTVDNSTTTPFRNFNPEVIFHSENFQSKAVTSKTAKIDTTLYNYYEGTDLRKKIFFKTNTDNTHAFKGSYAGSTNYDVPFSGIATDEMYLLRAECYARSNDIQNAMKDLNTLLANRYQKNTYQERIAINKDEALHIILNERRKELVMRGLRWVDLRRLNFEPAFQKTLVRKENGQQFQIAPNDSKYTFLIPVSVINLNTWEQNVR